MARRKDGVSAVVGEILLVAITIVLAAVLYLMVSAPSAPPTQGLSLVLNQRDSVHNATNASRNDTTFEVSAKLGSGDLLWNDSSLQSTVTATNGTSLSLHSVEFNDTIKDGKAGSGDHITVRGMTGAYHGASFMIFYNGRQVYSGILN